MKKTVFILISILFIFSCDKQNEFYIFNVNVVDVAAGRILEDQLIKIEDGIITNITGNYEIQEVADNSFDGGGMFVTPGLSDMKVFLKEGSMNDEYWDIHPGDRMLASGITTIRTSRFFKDTRVLVEHEDEIRGNLTAGPDIIKGTLANYTSGKNIENLMDEISCSEADYIYVQSPVSEREMDNILNYAAQNDIYTCCRLYGYNDLLHSSEIGLDELTDISGIITLLIDDDYIETIDWFDAEDIWKKTDGYFSGLYELSEEEILKSIKPKLEDIIEILKGRNIAVTTALSVDEISSMKIEDPDGYREYAEQNHVPSRQDTIYLWNKSVHGDHFRLEMIPEFVKFQYKIEKIILKELRANEVFVLLGTGFVSDAWYGIAPGPSLHDEFNILLDCGYSNLEALQTATLNASLVGERMGLSEKRGRAEPGYQADLIFTEGNPLESLDALRAPEYVMKTGNLYSKTDLQFDK